MHSNLNVSWEIAATNGRFAHKIDRSRLFDARFKTGASTEIVQIISIMYI